MSIRGDTGFWGANHLLGMLKIVILVGFLVGPAFAPPVVAQSCPDRPACKGCGCKGGPAYRGPDGKCVGFKVLHKVCGNPPETRCTFKNAPGTGEDRECAQKTERKNKG
jgi:hypothetical protein